MVKWPFGHQKKEDRKQELQEIERSREEAERRLVERRTYLDSLVEQIKKERQARP